MEQRNGSVVRRWVGYDHYASPAALQLVRRLYAALRPYVNYFHPVPRLVAKHREGGHLSKRYDAPATRYQRLVASGALTAIEVARLATEYAALNPAALLREITACQQALVRHIEHRTERRFGNTPSEATPALGNSNQ